ncbi:glucosamine-6-phosphate deaminase [Candidatus Epulonipiscioides gigas]|nr:glucosamine-6-phosphate deaminase [Epulopiscium sp. SCG-C07WGA-EpuloA2]
MKIIKANNYNDLSRKAANILSAQVILKPRSVLGLATGSSPLGTYKQLISWYDKDDIDFSEVTTVNLDEYVGLSSNNPQSYRYFMNTNFFDHINIDKIKTHLPNGIVKDTEKECERYNNLLHEVGGIDIQLLGLGLNGHIGFNEPGSEFEKLTHVVKLKEATVSANKRFFEKGEDVPKFAISMGIKSIMQAKHILLIVNGEEKYEILKQCLFGPVTPHVPGSILQLHSNLTVIYSCNKEL